MKNVLILFLFFGLGFGLHVWMVKDIVPSMDAVMILSKNVLGEDSKVDNFVTYVQFDGENFRPSSVNLVIGNYLAITNISPRSLMLLESDNTKLITPRGYGEGERLMMIMPEKGSFRVVEQNHPDSSLLVFVE